MKNRHRISRAWSSEREVCERLSRRLDDIAACDGRFDNTEKIKRLFKVMFGDEDEDEDEDEIELTSDAVISERIRPANP